MKPRPPRCCAVLRSEHSCKIERVQLCQQSAIVRYDGVPLCGTHVNHLPDRVCVEPVFGFGTVEKI